MVRRIGGQDGGKSAFDAALPKSGHGAALWTGILHRTIAGVDVAPPSSTRASISGAGTLVTLPASAFRFCRTAWET